MARALACRLSRLCRRRWQPRSPAGVDDGLDAQRAAVLEILLEAGMLVEGVDGDLGAAGDNLCLELATPGPLSATDLPVEDDLDGVRAAQVKVVGDQGFEETAGV